MSITESGPEAQDVLFEKKTHENLPPNLTRAALRMEFPPSYVFVGIYRLFTDKNLYKPAWDKCKHGTLRGAVVGGIWAFLTFAIQKKFIELFLSNSPRITGLSRNAMFGYEIPFNIHTYAALLIVGSQITYILRFFLARNIRIARDRAWDQTVVSRGKGPSFWQPYVEEWQNPPSLDSNSKKNQFVNKWLGGWFGLFVVKRILLSPLHVYPFVGSVVSAWFKALCTAQFLHRRYFEAKNMTPQQVAVFIEERKWDYRLFGFAAALLENIPVAGLIFTISNRVGAAMWAHGMSLSHIWRKGSISSPLIDARIGQCKTLLQRWINFRRWCTQTFSAQPVKNPSISCNVFLLQLMYCIRTLIFLSGVMSGPELPYNIIIMPRCISQPFGHVKIVLSEPGCVLGAVPWCQYLNTILHRSLPSLQFDIMAPTPSAPNIRIVGGKFSHIKGNLKQIDRSSHEININSNNVCNNKLIDSYNDNSKVFSSQNPRARLPRRDEENDAMEEAPTSADAGPPPPQPNEFTPLQIPSTGGHVVNQDSFNMYRNHIKDSYNDRSQTYYNGRARPTNDQRGCRSNSGSFENPSVQMPFHARLPQHRLTDPQIMRQTFLPAMKQTQSSSEENDIPNMPEYNDKTYDPKSDDRIDSFPHSTGENDSMSTRMADLSIRENPMPSPTQRDKHHPQVTTYRSPPTTFSSIGSDPRKPAEPQINPRGSSNPFYTNPYNSSNPHHSYPYPPMAPNIKEAAMVHFHARPSPEHPKDEIHRNNDLNNTPPISTSGINSPPSSSGGPIYRVINGDLTKINLTRHQKNFNSFNMEGNTIENSFNTNSLVEYSGNGRQGSNKAKVSRRTQ